MENILKVENLCKSFGKKQILSNISFEVRPGEILGFVGPNGAGKTTTIKLILGLQSIDSGDVFVNGHDITKYNNKQLTLYRRDDIGFVYQFFNLINELTVFQNVTLAPKSGRNKERAMKLLKSVGLADKKDKFPRQLSGGQQQRVAIARALNKDSNILLCDEPTGALDDVSGKQVLKLISKLHKEGKTIVFVTHTKEIAQMADRIITMKNGKVVKTTINEHPVEADEVEW
jgi:putative ABC transport system ATP-binding protein